MAMAYWKWDSAFSVGIDVIDEQHKRIIEYINELCMASMYRDKAQVKSILLALMDYTVSHFSFEESLMEEAGYGMLNSHKQAHSAFIKRIHFFIERFESGQDIAKELRLELQIWLINHIQHDDTDYQKIVQSMLEKKQMLPVEKEKWLTKLKEKFFK